MPKTRKITLKKSKTRKHGNKRGGEGKGHSISSLALSQKPFKLNSSRTMKLHQTIAPPQINKGKQLHEFYTDNKNLKTQINTIFAPSNLDTGDNQKIKEYTKKFEDYITQLDAYNKISSNKSCISIKKPELYEKCSKLRDEVIKLHEEIQKLAPETPIPLIIPNLPASIKINSVYLKKEKENYERLTKANNKSGEFHFN